tara:strand:- start:453 stop:743 length:291 start_codon:yes stop_codon:yes gene_type:complete
MIGLRDGASLGRCTWCKSHIKDGDMITASRWAKIIHTKWYCGDCLLSLKETVDEIDVHTEYLKDREEANAKDDYQMVNDKYFISDEGKLRRNPGFK